MNQQHDDESDESCDDLVLRECRRAHRGGEEQRPDEQEGEETPEGCSPVRHAVGVDDRDVKREGDQERRVEDQPGNELRDDDLVLGDRCRQERLERPGLSLLRDESHGDQRQRDHQR